MTAWVFNNRVIFKKRKLSNDLRNCKHGLQLLTSDKLFPSLFKNPKNSLFMSFTTILPNELGQTDERPARTINNCPLIYLLIKYKINLRHLKRGIISDHTITTFVNI